MNISTINNNIVESVSVNDTYTNTPRLTKEQAQRLSDAELLQMIDKAAGHTTKDFQDYMNCDFSYTTLTNLLRERGYENGWHKTSDGSSQSTNPTIIQMKKSEEECVRVFLSMDKSIADEWKKFNQDVAFKTVTNGWALRRFIDDYRAGRIEFSYKI